MIMVYSITGLQPSIELKAFGLIKVGKNNIIFFTFVFSCMNRSSHSQSVNKRVF